ncbi:MAG: ferritin [Methanomicrobiales archaeon]|nr:ferritin [Methanomicrobiales archaeon]MDI6875248.1 ferritin [Methanomicrobiales archaeon]
MIAESVQEALNKQINRELYSAYLYLSMSAYFESTSYRGMAKWMRTQALEEREHAMKIFDHVISRGGKISLMPIEAPRQVWSTPLEVFEEVHKHEQKVTNWIYDLMDLAIREKDHATANMVRWFVDEQVEEEASASDIVDRLKMIGEEKGLLLMLDAQLAERA